MKIGDRIYVRGYVDEIRKDTVIVRNNGGYFGTIPSEVITGELPSAQPERMKGKWERRLVDSGFNADWRCSKCGWKTALEEHGYNYCPNCGADMRGEQDDESRSNSNAQTDTRARGMGATDKSSGI